ncbi:thiamine biosynthesis protein thiS [Haloferula helveola]|uniref:Thiamine biosynthesis protein thiS n=1 Tax=Haloferula helveola TaxID=490095 RepID=A0ABN6H6A0_9BACT|nr:thiamine biosynthesis protein thiS [Haloferula helveola]
MTVTLNGGSRAFEPDSISLEALLGELDLGGKPVVVELNREPVLPSDYATTTIRDGDSLEIVRIAAGG